MSITKIYQSADGKIAKVKQDSDKLSAEQELQLREALGGTFFEVEEKPKTQKLNQRRKTDIYTSSGKFSGADYKTGVKNNAFRAAFSNLDSNKERSAYLRKKVGDDGYVIDKQGNYLLTPKGQKQLDESSLFGADVSNNLKAIDADANVFKMSTWEGEDFADFLGSHGIPTAFAVTTMFANRVGAAPFISRVAPKLAKNPTGFGFLAARNAYEGLAYGVGATVDELQQKIRGVSKENIIDASKEGFKEGALWWALPGFAFESALKGAGLLLAGKKPLAGFGSTVTDDEVRILKETMQQGKDGKGLRFNSLGPLGRKSAVLGLGVDFAQQFTGQYAKNQKMNFDDVLQQTSKELGIDLSNIKPESVELFKKQFTDVMKGKRDFKNSLVEEAKENMKTSLQMNLHDVFKHVDSGKTFDDIAEQFEANKALFYTDYGSGMKALDADNVAIASDMDRFNSAQLLKGDAKIYDVTNIDQAVRNAPRNNLTREQQTLLSEQLAVARTLSPEEQQLAGLTPEGIDRTRKAMLDANREILEIGGPDARALDDVLTTESAEAIFNNPTVRASTEIAEFFGKGTNNFRDDTYITLLKPDEVSLSKSDFAKKITEEGIPRVNLRIGRDVYGNNNVKAITPVNLKRTMNELNLGVEREIKGLAGIPAFNKIVNQSGVTPLTLREYADILTAINEINIKMEGADYGFIKDQTQRLLKAAFDDLDIATTKVADDFIEAQDTIKAFKDLGMDAPESVLKIHNELATNFDQGIKLRMLFKDFAEANNTALKLKVLDDVAKKEVDSGKIFDAMEGDPVFVAQLVNAFEKTAKADKIFKKGVPENYSPNLLKERQQELASDFLGAGVRDLDGNPLFQEATLKRLGKSIALTEQFPNMMNAAANAKEIRKRLAQLYIERLGNSPGELINLSVLKSDLDKAFTSKAISKEHIPDKFFKEGKRDLSVMDALFKDKDELILKNSLNSLRETLEKIPDDILNEMELEKVTQFSNKLNAVPEGEIKGITEVVDDYNKFLKDRDEFISSTVMKNIESGKITPQTVGTILKDITPSDIKSLKDSDAFQFKNFKELAYGSLIRETGKTGDEVFEIMEPAKLLKNIQDIGPEKFNLLFAKNSDHFPYDDIVKGFEALERVAIEPGIGSLAKIGLQYRILGKILPLGLLGGTGVAVGGGVEHGFISMGAGLMLLRGVAMFGTSRPLARALTAEIKAMNPEQSLFTDYVKSRNAIEKLILAPEGLKPLGLSLQKSLEEADQAYARANEIYGDEINYAGAISALPSVQAVQERQREVNRELMNPLKEPLPSIQGAIQRQKQVGSSTPLPQVNPVQLPNRRALAGNNPNTQDLADRLR